MRTTLNLPDELYRDVKSTAARNGVTVTSYVEEALREALRRQVTQPAQVDYVLPAPFHGDGVLPGVDINDNASLLEIMEGAVIVPDVNVLVPAFRAELEDHPRIAAWLTQAVCGQETVGLTDAVLGGFVRIVTNPRVFRTATPIGKALDQVAGLLAAPATTRIAPGPRHWQILGDLCRQADARGNLVADAQHAAVAIEHGATWVSQDRDFARFEGLRWTVVR